MKKKEIPETAELKLMYFVRELETFLHPRVTEALTKLVWDCRTEFAKAAKDQVFSKEMQELEPILERYRRDIILFTQGGADAKHLWHLRPLFAKIIELYGKDPDV